MLVTNYALLFTEEVTRDYMPHIPLDKELSRLAHLLPWNPCDFTDLDEIPDEPGDDYYKVGYLTYLLHRRAM